MDDRAEKAEQKLEHDGGKAHEKMAAQGHERQFVDAAGQAMAKMDKRIDNEKLNLSMEDMGKVKGIERALLTADSGSLNEKLAELARGKGPGEAEKLMDVVSKDLASVGIDARWSYTSRSAHNQYGDGYVRGQEDVGHLAVSKDNKNGTFTTVTYSTEGRPEGINRPIPSIDGSHSPLSDSQVNPAQGLRDIVDAAIKGKGK